MEIQERNSSPLEMRRNESFVTKMFEYLFYIQFVAITILEVYLIVRFHPKEWYLPILSSVACAGIIAFALQVLFTCFNPWIVLKAAFCISPLLTCAFGILLVSIGTPGSAAASVLALSSSVFQSLYACWVAPKFQHASAILTVSTTHNNPPKLMTILIPTSTFICTLYSAFLMSGIGGATASTTKLKALFIFLSLTSFTWTLQIARNMIYINVSHIKYMQFASGIQLELTTLARKPAMGSVCIGSILVPVVSLTWGSARAISLVSGDVDEFMFSCANCCSQVAEKLIGYGNQWGFVQVGVYSKGIVEASMDTWEMFTRTGIEKVINADLTSSLCFMCGIGAGSICALLGGSWALVIHKAYATEISLYAFLTGYLVTRVGTAWIQASVAAYYVAYAENPQSQRFDTTIPDYLQALQRLQG